MARLVAAYGSSHSPMLNSTLAEWLRYVELDEVRSFTVEPGTDLPYDGLLATAQKEDALLASPRDIERQHQAALHAIDTLRTLVHRGSLDVLLIVGDDQEEMFDLSNMPALAIYYGASIDNYVKPVTHAANWPACFRRLSIATLKKPRQRHTFANLRWHDISLGASSRASLMFQG